MLFFISMPRFLVHGIMMKNMALPLKKQHFLDIFNSACNSNKGQKCVKELLKEEYISTKASHLMQYCLQLVSMGVSVVVE